MLTKKKIFIHNNIINLLIAFIPLSLIIGNLAININIILICLMGITIYKLEIFRINEKKYQYLLYAFFLYLILITFFKNFPNISENILYKEHIIKSFLFLRFLIFFLVINKIIEKDCFNIKLFLASCVFCAIITSIDIVIQVTFGKNLLGEVANSYRPSGFFGSENIAGGYLQKFSFLSIIFIISYIQKRRLDFYSLLLFFIFFIPIILTGNRMPLLLYFTSVLAFYVLQKKIKYCLVFLLLCSLLVFSLLKYFEGVPQNNKTFYKNFSETPLFYISVNLHSFYASSKLILNKSTRFFQNSPTETFVQAEADSNPNIKVSKIDNDMYILHYYTGIEIWKKNKFFGSGIKSFRLKCTYDPGQTCNSHPHNYVIELLVDVGIVGLILIYLIFSFAIFDFFKFYRNNSNINSKLLSFPFFLILCLEFFPLRSTGSFFTTGNAVIIFFMLAVTIGLSNFKKSKVI